MLDDRVNGRIRLGLRIIRPDSGPKKAQVGRLKSGYRVELQRENDFPDRRFPEIGKYWAA